MKTSHDRAEPARRRRRVASYLEQLRQLVPLVPHDRPVTQLEVIQHVIDYISELEQQLERRQEQGQDQDRQEADKRRPLQEVSRNNRQVQQSPAAPAQLLKQVQPRRLA